MVSVIKLLGFAGSAQPTVLGMKQTLSFIVSCHLDLVILMREIWHGKLMSSF